MGGSPAAMLRRNKRIESRPLLGVDRMDKGLNGLFWIHESDAAKKDESQVYVV